MTAKPRTATLRLVPQPRPKPAQTPQTYVTPGAGNALPARADLGAGKVAQAAKPAPVSVTGRRGSRVDSRSGRR
jgi:hypothetical protein